MRYFYIRQTDGLITNVIIWDGVSPWQAREGFYVLPESDNPDAKIGWRKIKDGWEAPPSNDHFWDGNEWKEIEENK